MFCWIVVLDWASSKLVSEAKKEAVRPLNVPDDELAAEEEAGGAAIARPVTSGLPRSQFRAKEQRSSPRTAD